ncbi:SLC13 family permease [Methanococcoides sp. FTZ1]|uniref:SLC13 family permease n=1 Tax=Methanococcoides sp. FTZ1 TaxID=3439061 RepID=UPI003F82B3A5
MIIPIVVLSIVLLLITFRQVGHFRIDMWQSMLLGAVAVLLTGQISFSDAFAAVNLDVMFFLFGMFIIGKALEDSGYLFCISYALFKRAGSLDSIIICILFVMGFASAFLMNDTLAIIGTPVVLLLAKENGVNPKVLLLALAFAVTTGSVVSPIGNPQNLLIALESGIEAPFIVFMKHLLLPTLVNLFITYLFLKLFYREHFSPDRIVHSPKTIADEKLALLSRISLSLVVVFVLAKLVLFFIYPDIEIRLTYIAMIAALPILLFSDQRVDLVKHIDWHTLFYFVSMFILMESVWNSGFFQSAITLLDIDITSMLAILLISVILSQFISNVPLVALYIPLLLHSGVSVESMVTLAAGSTIAGNLSVVGAASNVIIIQNAEKRSDVTLNMAEFMKIGVPLTAVQLFVYWTFLSF